MDPNRQVVDRIHKEVLALPGKSEPGGWYSADGDCLFFYAEDVPYYGVRLTEHVTVFERVLEAHSNITWRRMKSTECPEPAKPIGLLLIDGEHDHPAPREDFEHFEPWLAPRALVLFHDYKVCRGVTETADALVEGGRIERVRLRERLFVATRPPDA